MAALALSAAIIASKMMTNRHQKTVIQTAPVVLVAPRPNAPMPSRIQEAPALPPALQSAASPVGADVPAPTADPRGSDSSVAPVAETSLPAAAAQASDPAAPQAAIPHAPHRVEQRIESKMHAADPDGLGLTREQFAQTFPRLSEHFDQIDTDRDGRITPQELMIGWQRFWAKSAQDAQ